MKPAEERQSVQEAIAFVVRGANGLCGFVPCGNS